MGAPFLPDSQEKRRLLPPHWCGEVSPGGGCSKERTRAYQKARRQIPEKLPGGEGRPGCQPEECAREDGRHTCCRRRGLRGDTASARGSYDRLESCWQKLRSIGLHPRPWASGNPRTPIVARSR